MALFWQNLGVTFNADFYGSGSQRDDGAQGKFAGKVAWDTGMIYLDHRGRIVGMLAGL